MFSTYPTSEVRILLSVPEDAIASVLHIRCEVLRYDHSGHKLVGWR